MTQSDHEMGYIIHERIGGTRVGDLLRRRRAELGQDIGVVARSLRIRQRYLEAIEEGRLGELPGPTYVLGFVRSYAEHLGFDGTKIIAEFRQEVGVAGPPQPMNWKEQSAPVGPGRILLVFLVLVLVAVGAGWYYFGVRIAPASFIESLPNVMRPRAEALPPESSMDASELSAMTGGTQTATSITEGSVGEADVTNDVGANESENPSADAAAPASALPDQSTSDTSVALSSQPVENEPTAEGSNSNVQTVTAASQPTTSGGTGSTTVVSVPQEVGTLAVPPGPRMVIRARLESWVEIVNAKKEVIVSRVFRAGETFVVPEEPGLIMSTGNAGGLDVEIDGRSVPSLGAIGLVRRGIALDPALLAGGETQAAPSTSTAPGQEDVTTGD